jgi:hypothetical protein
VSRQATGNTKGKIPSMISINAIASNNELAMSMRGEAPRSGCRGVGFY